MYSIQLLIKAEIKLHKYSLLTDNVGLDMFGESPCII